MKKMLVLLVLIVLGLSVSVIPVSAQRGRSQDRPVRDEVVALTRANQVFVARMGNDRSWRRPGPYMGRGIYRGGSWSQFGQQALLMGLEAVIVRQQMNAVVAMSRPPVPYGYPQDSYGTGQPQPSSLPAVYQPPPQPMVAVQKVGPPTPDDYRTEGEQNATSRCVFNGGDTVRNAFSYPIIVRQVAPNGGVRDMMTLLGGQSACLPQVPLDGSWWYEAVARVNVNGGVTVEGEDLRVRGGVELGRLFAQGFPGGWLFMPPPASERQ